MPRLLSIRQLAEALVSWMDGAGITKAVLIGNSLGCQIAVECGLRRSDKILAIVVQGPTPDPPRRTARQSIPRVIWNTWREDPVGLGPLLDYAQAGIRRAVRTAQHLLHDPIEKKLPLVKVPARVIRGDKDTVITTVGGGSRAALAERGTARGSRCRPHHGHGGAARRNHTAVRSLHPTSYRRRRLNHEGQKMTLMPPSYISNFDSASGFLRATALYLKGKDFPGGGLSKGVKAVVPAIGQLPRQAREAVYAAGGLQEGISPAQTHSDKGQMFSRSVARARARGSDLVIEREVRLANLRRTAGRFLGDRQLLPHSDCAAP